MLVLTVYSFFVWMSLIAFTLANLEMEGKLKLFYGVSHLGDIVVSLLFIRGESRVYFILILCFDISSLSVQLK